MSEYADYTPAPAWKGHDFKSAYSAFDQNAGRAYAEAKAKGLTAGKLLPVSVSTDSTHPLIIDTDFTGSMNGWDATIFSKLPYLDHEMRTEYLSEDAEVSVGAIADTGDDYPLQIRPFAKGAELKKRMEELVHASGGSGPGSYCEAHGLAALYRLHNTHTPKAIIKPIYLIITDEMPYQRVSVDEAKDLAKVAIEHPANIEKVFEELVDRYALYVVLKPYNSGDLSGDTLSGVTKQVHAAWEKLLGADHIALLPDPNRVVDVIFGILAKESGRIEYFRQELEARQLPDQGGKAKVETVYKSLKTVHALPKPDANKNGSSSHSKTRGVGSGTPTKRLGG